ncbi:MAG TPA: hypothetical protein VGO47_11400 [Chlamydiales bacterium]|nr:hypothetical protein [Chlamydiales bacterium]
MRTSTRLTAYDSPPLTVGVQPLYPEMVEHGRISLTDQNRSYAKGYRGQVLTRQPEGFNRRLRILRIVQRGITAIVLLPENLPLGWS